MHWWHCSVTVVLQGILDHLRVVWIVFLVFATMIVIRSAARHCAVLSNAMPCYDIILHAICYAMVRPRSELVCDAIACYALSYNALLSYLIIN